MSKQPPQQQQRALLFFSLYCEHSKGLLSYIARKGMNKMFMFVNVDKHRPIPPFIDRVPFIILPDKSTLSGENLFGYVEKVAQSVNNENINAYFDNEMGSSMSDSYSYLDDSASGVVERSFSMITNNFAIPTPKEDEFRSSNSTEMDKLKLERELDVKQLFKGQTPAR